MQRPNTKHEVDGHAVTLIGYTTYGDPSKVHAGAPKSRQGRIGRTREDAMADLKKRKGDVELLAVVADCNDQLFLAKADLSAAIRDSGGYVVGIDLFASGNF